MSGAQDPVSAMMNMWMGSLGGARMPLSGNVVQSINPMTEFMKKVTMSLFSVHIGGSKNPVAEEVVNREYGNVFDQLQIVADALEVVVSKYPMHGLTERETLAILTFKAMMDRIDTVEQATPFMSGFGSPPPGGGFGGGGMAGSPYGTGTTGNGFGGGMAGAQPAPGSRPAAAE